MFFLIGFAMNFYKKKKTAKKFIVVCKHECVIFLAWWELMLFCTNTLPQRDGTLTYCAGKLLLNLTLSIVTDSFHYSNICHKAAFYFTARFSECALMPLFEYLVYKGSHTTSSLVHHLYTRTPSKLWLLCLPPVGDMEIEDIHDEKRQKIAMLKFKLSPTYFKFLPEQTLLWKKLESLLK